MGFIKEFRTFINRGNVLDLAVGVVIGGAFGKITGSLVNDILMPPLGLALAGTDFKKIKLTLKEETLNDAGEVLQAAVTMNVGNFLQTLIDFIIIAFAIFIVVRSFNAMKKKEKAAPAPPPAAPAPPTKEEQLLTEIRDLLRKP